MISHESSIIAIVPHSSLSHPKHPHLRVYTSGSFRLTFPEHQNDEGDLQELRWAADQHSPGRERRARSRARERWDQTVWFGTGVLISGTWWSWSAPAFRRAAAAAHEEGGWYDHRQQTEAAAQTVHGSDRQSESWVSVFHFVISISCSCSAHNNNHI